ncbi:cbb3-type cytochrome oxidase assembly protein CcoS [Rhodobacteraceae bacterium F11138]|nr:cbb3-type cytochrome oxidase assembly protein CcoS [Rhodobacteraceae bacterium F11138]
MSWAILIPVSIGMGLIGVLAFVWALRNDQFEDPDGNASRVLLNDPPPQPKDQPPARRERREGA